MRVLDLAQAHHVSWWPRVDATLPRSETTVMTSATMSEYRSGFDFSGHVRNAALTARGHVMPRATSTGTTIVGLIYKDGVVLGADTRATEGPIVADKNCEKIHYITESIRCCGAGTAADTEFVTNMISSNMQLHELHTRKKPRVLTAMTMLKQRLFQYQGYIGAALVLGGYDTTGPQLFTIAPHGSTDKLPYVTMGSGSLAAMSVFESRWRPQMDVCCLRLIFRKRTLFSSSSMPLNQVSSMIWVQAPMWMSVSSGRSLQRCFATTGCRMNAPRRSKATSSRGARPGSLRKRFAVW